MNDREFEEAFARLRRHFPHETKRKLLRDIQDALADSELYEDVKETPLKRRYVAVSADKTRGRVFSYHHFDFLLGVLSYLHGGSTWPSKPVNQNRVIVWRNRRTVLRDVLLFLRRNFGASHDVRFSRVLVLPYPLSDVGHQLAAIT